MCMHVDVYCCELHVCMSVQNSYLLQYTPLHWAAQYGHVDVVRALIAAGADAREDFTCQRILLSKIPVYKMVHN